MSLFGEEKSKIKLDIIDKKILYYLGENFRISRKKLAKILRISPQKLHYRVKQLNKKSIQPTIILNYPEMGIHSYYIIIYGEIQPKIKKILLNHPDIYFFFETLEPYSAIINIISNNPKEFCERYLNEHVVDIHQITNYYPGNLNPFLLNIQYKEKEPKHENIQLNQKDYALLHELAKDSTLSKIDLAEKANIDRKTVTKIINKLLRGQIILKFRYAFDVYRQSLTPYFILIKTSMATHKKALQIIKESNYDGFTYESHNLLLHQHISPSQEQLSKFIIELKKLKIPIEILNITGKYNVECIPEKALEIFKERSLKK